MEREELADSSSESEVVALDAGARLEGIPAVALWEEILDVFAPGLPAGPPKNKASTLTSRDGFLSELDRIIETMDYVPPMIPPASGKGKLVLFEDNEAVIKMAITGRSK